MLLESDALATEGYSVGNRMDAPGKKIMKFAAMHASGIGCSSNLEPLNGGGCLGNGMPSAVTSALKKETPQTYVKMLLAD